MYLLIVLLLMLVLPVASVAIDWAMNGGMLVELVGKWFVFWSVGVRLLTAGARQVFNPAFTAETIFESKDPVAKTLVTELGFANVAIGVVGVASLWLPAWLIPAAVYGLIFYGLATAKHLMNSNRNRTETIATISDAWITVVLAAFFVALITA